jgi:hypothetical protein
MYVSGDLNILAKIVADVHCLSLNFEIALCYPFIKAPPTPYFCIKGFVALWPDTM